jgi:hypothetical protein
MAGVLVDALVRVGADLAGTDQTKGAPGFKPLVQQIAHKAFAQPDLGRLVEPGLSHVEDQKPAGNHAKGSELDEKAPEVLVRQRIVEGPVPGVEFDLAKGGGADDGHKGGAEP